ncbi:phospholipase-like protein [Tanacetum coccineum]
MSCYSANNKNKLQFQLMDVGNKLFHLSSSTPDILSVLMSKRSGWDEVELERIKRMRLKENQSWRNLGMEEEQNLKALIAKKLVRHPDVNVNISVVCCICEIIRMMASAPYNHEDMKEFFEVLVTSFEKQSSAAGGYRGKMTRVLEIFRKTRLPAMMLDLHVEGLVGRLFKQFLTSADSNTSDTLLEMEKLMTTIIVESGELAPDLKALIITTLDKIDSPVCWLLGKRVLLNCAAKLQPRLLDMEAKETIPSISETSSLRNDTLQEAKETILSISETSNLRNDTLQEVKETIPSISETSNLRNNTTHKIKVECLEESVDTVQTLTHREHATTDRVNLPAHHAEEGKKKVSSDDPLMPSKSVTEVTGKRKRNNEQVLPFASGNYSSMAVVCGPVLRVLPKSAYSWTREDAKKKVSSNDPPMPSKSVTEVTGKRKRNNEQVLPFASGNYSSMAVVCGSVLRFLPKFAYSRIPKSNPYPAPAGLGMLLLLDTLQGVPRKVLYSMTHVQGYKVKKINAPILEDIFKKHGDIASDCVVKTASVRESILEVVCEVVKRIQTNDVATIVSDMEQIETQVLDAEATNMKVAWLRAHLEAIQKRNAAQKKSTLIVKMKANTSLVKRAAKTDLEERRIELLTAQERFDKAEKCVKVLDIVEMKLNDNFVESEAEKDLWPEQPIL